MSDLITKNVGGMHICSFVRHFLKKTFISQVLGNTTVSSYINAILCNPE